MPYDNINKYQNNNSSRNLPPISSQTIDDKALIR